MYRNRSLPHLVSGLAFLLAAVLLPIAWAPASSSHVGPSDERATTNPEAQEEPLRLAIAGLVHGHVHGVLGGLDDRPDIFLDWLLDPEQNGGGALYDFGCYGANLITWLMEGRRRDAVTARIRQIKSDPAYRAVDDEATILLEYPETHDPAGVPRDPRSCWSTPRPRASSRPPGTGRTRSRT